MLDQLPKPSKISGQVIRYSQCWEDADLLLSVIAGTKARRILSIASAGDNTLSLLCHAPESVQEVIAIDFSPAQLSLLELKIACFKALSWPETLQFLGAGRQGQDQGHDNTFSLPELIKVRRQRRALYRRLRVHLSERCRRYFDLKFLDISRGVLHMGKLEGYFTLFRKLVLPAVHGKATVEGLLKPKELKAQELFYKNHWNSPSYKFFSRLFFSSPVLGLLGRERQFFEHAEDSLSAFVTGCVARHFSSGEVFDNPYLSYILRGRFDGALPHYLREENFEIIKANLHKITLKSGSLQSILQELLAEIKSNGGELAANKIDVNKIDIFNVSDVFEYMDETQTRELSQLMVQVSNGGAQVIYWNMLVDRLMSQYNPAIKSQLKLDETLPEKTGTFFYKRFLLDKIGEVA